MFWKKKKKVANTSKKPSREQIIAEAKENARIATEAIGRDTLDRIRERISQDENSEFHQALRKIKAMDQDRISDNIRAIYRDK